MAPTFRCFHCFWLPIAPAYMPQCIKLISRKKTKQKNIAIDILCSMENSDSGYNSIKKIYLSRQKGKNKEEVIWRRKNATQTTTTRKTTQSTKRGKCFLIDITLIIIIHGNTSYQQFRSNLLAHSLFYRHCGARSSDFVGWNCHWQVDFGRTFKTA